MCGLPFLRRAFPAGRACLRKAGLVWRFYRSSLLLPCLCVSLPFAWTAMQEGGPNVPTLCMAKAACYAPMLYLLFSLGPRRFYYYANLGLPRRRLVAWCCTADFLLFVALARAAALFAAANRTV